jgi:hypothetical protein
VHKPTQVKNGIAQQMLWVDTGSQTLAFSVATVVIFVFLNFMVLIIGEEGWYHNKGNSLLPEML